MPRFPRISRRGSRESESPHYCLQVCQKLADKQKKVLYISGEESLKQIKLRANRMGEFADSLCCIM